MSAAVMTGTGTRDAHADPGEWLGSVAASLAGAGMPGRVCEAAGEGYLSVTVAMPGLRDAELVVNQDGYCEVRWWLSRHAGPAVAAAVVAAVLGAAGARAVPGPAGS